MSSTFFVSNQLKQSNSGSGNGLLLRLLLFVVAFFGIGANAAHATEYYYKIELKDGKDMVINHFDITIEANSQDDANTAAVKEYESKRLLVCALIDAKYCEKPYRWDVYKAVKAKQLVCSMIIEDASPSDVHAAPSPSCVEEEVFQIIGPAIASSGGSGTPTTASPARVQSGPAIF